MAIVGWILLAFGALNIVGNLGLVVRCIATGKGASLVPVLGGVFAFAGSAILIGGWLGLVAFVIDPGCAYMAFAAIASARRA